MRRIVSAGLPSHIATFLARQLEDVSVLITFSGDDALAELRAGRTSVLFIDSDVPGLPAESVLRSLREESTLDSLPVVYCLADGDKAGQEASRQRLLREFPDIRVLLHPLSLADVSRVATMLLAPPPVAAPASTRDLHVAETGSKPQVAANSQSRRSFSFRRAS